MPRLLCAFVLFAFVIPVFAEDGPLTYDDIRQLRRKRTLHTMIVDIAGKRGLAFEVEGPMIRKLRETGFNRKQIDQLRNARATHKQREAESIEKQKEMERRKNLPFFKPKDDNDPAAIRSRQAARFGPRMADAFHNRFKSRIMRINQLSKTMLPSAEAGHITMLASKKHLTTYLPDVRKLEGMISKQYGAPLAAGPDKRSAFIVLIDTEYEYQAFIKTLFIEYKKDGITFTNPDALNFALRSSSFMIRGVCITCLEKRNPGTVRNTVAYDVGYLYMQQVAEGRAPAALVTGFGNVCEVMLTNRAITTVMSYEHRDLGAGNNTWKNMVKDSLANDRLKSLKQIIRYSTADMILSDYAECWMLTTWLTNDPQAFTVLVRAMRDMTKTLDALPKIYGAELEQLFDKWNGWVERQ